MLLGEFTEIQYYHTSYSFGPLEIPVLRPIAALYLLFNPIMPRTKIGIHIVIRYSETCIWFRFFKVLNRNALIDGRGRYFKHLQWMEINGTFIR